MCVHSAGILRTVGHFEIYVWQEYTKVKREEEKVPSNRRSSCSYNNSRVYIYYSSSKRQGIMLWVGKYDDHYGTSSCAAFLLGRWPNYFFNAS